MVYGDWNCQRTYDDGKLTEESMGLLAAKLQELLLSDDLKVAKQGAHKTTKSNWQVAYLSNEELIRGL